MESVGGDQWKPCRQSTVLDAGIMLRRRTGWKCSVEERKETTLNPAFVTRGSLQGERGAHVPGAEAGSEAGAGELWAELGGGPGARTKSIGMRRERWARPGPGGRSVMAELEPSPWWHWGTRLGASFLGKPEAPSATGRGLSAGKAQALGQTSLGDSGCVT